MLLAFLVVQVFADVTLPTYTARIVEQMQAGAEALSILRTGGIMLAFAAVSVLATIAETFLSASISTGLGRRLRGRCSRTSYRFPTARQARLRRARF